MNIPILPPDQKTINRFLSKFLINNKNGCWEWQAAKLHGYGTIGIGNPARMVLAHRFSYTFFVGAIPEGFCVCHTCDNPCCVNPSHLWLGTNDDNVRDRVKKCRGMKLKISVEERIARTNQWLEEHKKK